MTAKKGVPEGTIPLLALKDLCDSLVQSCERTLRLAIDGISLHQGKVPKWIEHSIDFSITGIKKGSTILELEVPQLAETATTQLAQKTLWNILPAEEDTAMTVLSKSWLDATSRKFEEDRVDNGVLGAFLGFKSLTVHYFDSISIIPPKGRAAEEFKFGWQEIEIIEELKNQTPAPQVVVLSGTLDIIKHSDTKFYLLVENGRKIPGYLDPDFVEVENLRDLWGKHVTLKGRLFYNSANKPKYVRASLIREKAKGEQIFSLTQSLPFEGVQIAHHKGQNLASLWGQWPGDESIEVLLQALKS